MIQIKRKLFEFLGFILRQIGKFDFYPILNANNMDGAVLNDAY